MKRIFAWIAFVLTSAVFPAYAVNTWYVDDALGKDDGTFDGKSAATPFKTIGKAIASVTPTDATKTQADPGDTIWVADGTYYITATLTSENSFRLMSISGDRTKCIVDAQGLCPCVRLPTTGANGNHSRCWKICGITFRNGFSDKGDSWEDNNGEQSYSAAGLGLGSVAMVSNCVVASCRRSVSTLADGSAYRYLAGGGIALRGYQARVNVGQSFGSNWKDVTPGIYDSVVTNCSLFTDAPRAGQVCTRGGGLYAYYSVVSNVLVTGCSVSNAYPSATWQSISAGGGIFAHTASRIVDCTVRTCVSARVPGTVGWSVDGFYGSGGGIYANNGDLNAQQALTYDTDVIRDCLVEENTVVGMAAGGLMVESYRVVNSTIRTNHLIAARSESAYRGGTGVKVSGTGPVVQGCLIEGNDGTDERYGYYAGGALEVQSSTGARITDTVIRDNVGGHRGGLSLCYNTVESFVSNVVVVGNVATNRSDAAFSSGSCKSMLLTDSIFVGNRGGTHSTAYNGYEGLVALGTLNTAYSNVVFRNTLFKGNETTANAGWLIGGSYSATRAAGWQPLTFENCSFVANTNRTGWGTMQAISFGDASTIDLLKMKGCVIAGNVFGSPSQGNRGGFGANSCQSDITYSYCDATRQMSGGNVACEPIPVTAENHNMDGGGSAVVKVDPKFVDAAHGDFRLAKGSPLIDAGGPFASWMGTGSRRSVQDMGDGGYTTTPAGKRGVCVLHAETKPRRSGQAVDMGCFEYFTQRGFIFSFR